MRFIDAYYTQFIVYVKKNLIYSTAKAVGFLGGSVIIIYLLVSVAIAGVYDTSYMAQYSQNLTTAITRIGTSHKRLVFHDTVTLSADCNAPDNIAFDISENGLITLGDYDLYVHGDFHCEPGNRAFSVSGSGRVYFRGNIDSVYPEWFGAVGDGSTDDTDAFTYAHQAGQGVIELGSKTYDVSTLRIQQPMKGVSHQKSIIDVTGAGLYLSPTADEKFIEVSDIKICGTSASYGAILMDCNQSRGYLKNLYIYTDGNNDLTGIRLRSSHHSNLQNILMYGGTGDGFNLGLHIDSDATYQVNHTSGSNLYFADCNVGIYVDQSQNNNVFTGVYLEECTTGVYFASNDGIIFNGLWWDAVTTWLNCAYAGGNYSYITTFKSISDVLDNSSGVLENLTIEGRAMDFVKALSGYWTKTLTISTDPNATYPPEIRFFGWGRSADSNYGFSQGGISISTRPTYGKFKVFTYDGSTDVQYFELDPTTSNYVKQRVIGASGQYTTIGLETSNRTLPIGEDRSTWSNALKKGWRILGVTVRVATAITGATSFQVGDESDPNRWGEAISIDQGTTTDPSDFIDESVAIYDADQDCLLYALGGDYAGGVVRMVVHYEELGAPTGD